MKDMKADDEYTCVNCPDLYQMKYRILTDVFLMKKKIVDDAVLAASSGRG